METLYPSHNIKGFYGNKVAITSPGAPLFLKWSETIYNRESCCATISGHYWLSPPDPYWYFLLFDDVVEFALIVYFFLWVNHVLVVHLDLQWSMTCTEVDRQHHTMCRLRLYLWQQLSQELEEVWPLIDQSIQLICDNICCSGVLIFTKG